MRSPASRSSPTGSLWGDTVLVDENDYVSEVVGTSWHRALRFLITPELPSAELEEAVVRIKAEIAAAGLFSEWNGDRFVAVDVPPGDEPSQLFAVYEPVEVAKLLKPWSHEAGPPS